MAIGRCQEIRAKNADHELNLLLGKRLMNVHLKGGHADAQERSEEFDGERHGWIGLDCLLFMSRTTSIFIRQYGFIKNNSALSIYFIFIISAYWLYPGNTDAPYTSSHSSRSMSLMRFCWVRSRAASSMTIRFSSLRLGQNPSQK